MLSRRTLLTIAGISAAVVGFISGQAAAQFAPQMTMMGTGRGAAAPTDGIFYQDSALQNPESGTTSFSFTARTFGTATATRVIAVGIVGHLGSGTGNGVSGVTVGGVSATQATSTPQNNTGGEYSDIWYTTVSSGTTGDVVVTCTSSTRMGIAIWSILGSPSFSVGGGNKADVGSGASSLGTTITVPSAPSGVVALNAAHTSGQTYSGTNLTIDQSGLILAQLR
jgi:hypothetical protein